MTGIWNWGAIFTGALGRLGRGTVQGGDTALLGVGEWGGMGRHI